MSASLGCPRCGFQNPAGYQYCTNCGAPLGGASPGFSVPAAAPTPAYGYSMPPVNYDWPRQVERTKTGVLLLLLGSLLSWLPYGIGVIGAILLLVGAILVILGRKAFGASHSRNVIISIVLFCIGILVVIVVAIAALIPSFQAIINAGGVLTPATRAAAQSAGLAAAIASAVILGIAEVLFTYALQAQQGRVLLWMAYGANLAIAVALFLVLAPSYNAVTTQAEFDRAYSQQILYSLLAVLPALIFAGADYLAYARISRKEIPPAPTPPAPPPYVPPATFTAAAPSTPPPTGPPRGPVPPLNPK